MKRRKRERFDVVFSVSLATLLSVSLYKSLSLSLVAATRQTWGWLGEGLGKS